MKKKLLFIILALLGMTQVAAQEEYTPFVREGVHWVCYFVTDQDYMGFKRGQTFFTLELKGDTVIDGKQYKAMHKYSGAAIDPDNDTILVYLREQDRIVYAIIPDGKTYSDFVVGYGNRSMPDPYNMYHIAASGKEFILYNFKETETYYDGIMWLDKQFYNYLGQDKKQVGDHSVNRYRYDLNGLNDFYLIEGIGYDGLVEGYTLCYFNRGDLPYYLSHVMEDGKIIYKGANYIEPAPKDGRMPMAREGMQWVFERVITTNGKSTSQYYSYELCGKDPRGDILSEDFDHNYAGAKYCRYYDGVKAAGSEADIVCSLREGSSSVMAIDNTIMDKVEAQGRNQIRRMYTGNNMEVLYSFNHKKPEDQASIYIGWQLSPRLLTSDNFKLVDPIEIDGYSCNRYAYIGEDGEPLCYIIEGIGIDSRDMGDLLAPFTRLPDPDADYQEYCGLSHVVKDGKIIYKGMRYNAARVEEATHRYDVNGDGETNITDVTALIDLLLGSPSLQQQSSDVDASGEVTIADVTTLIDYLLSR